MSADDVQKLADAMWKAAHFIEFGGRAAWVAHAQAAYDSIVAPALTARVAELERERAHVDAKNKRLLTLARHDQTQIGAEQEMAVWADRRAEALSARVKALEEALRPFVEVGELSAMPDDQMVTVTVPMRAIRRAHATLGAPSHD